MSEKPLPITVGMTVANAERILIVHTVSFCHGNKTRAAAMLDISLKTLYNKLHEYGELPLKKVGG